MTLYPLRFKPIFRRYLWGGHRLASELGKPTGDETCAESWEVVDHGEDQSVVAYGPRKGETLANLVAQSGCDLFGKHDPLPQFPLLVKFLDAQKTLSVQVHPNDAQAALLDPPDRGKTEAWIILAAEPGSKVYAGLRRGFDRQALAREVSRGTSELCLHAFEPSVGDCIFIPAGTVHALGEGLLVAEIQQASDTTYRLFDWNRVGADGKPRELHIEQALEVIDDQFGPADPLTPQPTDIAERERLVACDKFVIDRWRLDKPAILGGDDRCHILIVLEGELTVTGDPAAAPLAKGQTMLLPAACGPTDVHASSETIFLDAYLP